MAREYIPDAIDGAAPGLEIRTRIGRLHPSDDDASVAFTTLTNKQLEGIPVAQKLPSGKFRYLDKNGQEITKQEAMDIAGGVVYYQQAANPSKGRLRLSGSFVSEDDARTIASESRAASDVADLRDLNNLDVIDEEMPDDGDEHDLDDTQGKDPWCFALHQCLLFAIVLMISLGSVCLATTQDMPLLEGTKLSPTFGYEARAYAHGASVQLVANTDADSWFASMSAQDQRLLGSMPISACFHVAAMMVVTGCGWRHLHKSCLYIAFTCALVVACLYLTSQRSPFLLGGTDGSTSLATKQGVQLLGGPNFSTVYGCETQAYSNSDPMQLAHNMETESQRGNIPAGGIGFPGVTAPISIALQVAAMMAVSESCCRYLYSSRLAFPVTLAVAFASFSWAYQRTHLLLEGQEMPLQLES
jgi:hypothetical protein